MYTATEATKTKNQWVTLQLRDIFTTLCNQFSQVVCQTSTEHLHSLKTQIIPRQEQYADLDQDPAPSPPGCPYPHGADRDTLHTALQEPLSEADYFQGLRHHTKTVANLNQYDLAALIAGRYTLYFWTPVKGLTRVFNHAVDTTVVPVGGYGESCALKMLHTTTLLAQLCESFLTSAAATVEVNHWDMISTETATGRQKKRAQDQLNIYDTAPNQEPIPLDAYCLTYKQAHTISVLDAFKEGIQSLQASVSSLMAQTLPAYPHAEDLLTTIFAEELPIEFAKIVPFGYTLPVIRSGRFFPDILELYTKDQTEKLRISLTFKKIARRVKEDYLTQKVYANNEHNPGFLGYGCPLSFQQEGFEETGIGYIMKAYHSVFQRL